ncbi:MAG: HAD family hydrolase [Ruminococcaceae bacterium]|nr:HAD family hydrolase [Oscillospiraceae bacterium]
MNDSLKLLHPNHLPKGNVRAAIFDFDGTFSTLRCGWEKVMQKLMLDLISGGKAYDDALINKVDAYIDASTGIQTVYQMQWLKDQVEEAGYGQEDRDVWWYKDQYNARLMKEICQRISRLEKGEDSPEQYLVAGAVNFLHTLRNAGIAVYLASGTDHKDVLHEATVLGVANLFSVIKGAPERQVACSKEAVLEMLLQESGLPAESILLVGDGKVEIALGAKNGCYTLGVASDEENLRGINPVKRKRLQIAGADAIVGDFENLCALRDWLQI